jgi:hypothetical protein
MDRAKITQILQRLSHHIGGDWLLVGGALVQIEIDGTRATEDVDLAFMGHPSKSLNFLQDELFQYSLSKLKVGPESLNLAVSFFLNQIPDWHKECHLLLSGPVGNIYRPSLTLFIALKLNRASSIDLQDIKLALKKFPNSELNEEKLKKWVNSDKFNVYLKNKN